MINNRSLITSSDNAPVPRGDRHGAQRSSLLAPRTNYWVAAMVIKYIILYTAQPLQQQ